MQINGKPVKDAKRNVTLTITPKDVRESRVKAHHICAAAVACVRHLKANSARVNLAVTFLEFKDHWLRFMTPRTLRQEIVTFDRGGAFAPGDYQLYAPKGHTVLGSSHYRPGQKKSAAPRKRIAPRHITTGVRASLQGAFGRNSQKTEL